MKRVIIFLVGFMILCCVSVSAEEMTFDRFKKLVSVDVVPKGFTRDESRLMDMRSSFQAEFKGDESKMEKITIRLSLRKSELTQIDKLGDPELYKYKDRPALYKDGKKMGMAGFILILRNRKGKLTISHRVFGGKFLDKAGFEKIIEKIGLDNLEK